MRLALVPLILLTAACSRETPPQTNAPQASHSAEAPVTLPQGTHRMKLVQLLDRNGFEKPLPSASLLVPAHWQADGATQWNIKDYCNTVLTSFKAEAPDGHAFEVFPEFNWKWADNTTALKLDFAQKQQMGAHACDVMPPMSAADYLRRNLVRARPGAQIVSTEPLPKLLAGLQQQARAAERQAAQLGLHEQIRPDLVRARLKYDINGLAVEEWIVVKTVTLGITGPFGVSYSCNATAIAERAPAGELDASQKLFDLILSTIRVNSEWQRRMTNNAQTMQQIELQGVRDRSAIISKNADEIRNIQRQGYDAQQQSQDRTYAQLSESVRGVETYRNPSSGETIELSNQFGNAWVNNRGEYLLSDQPGFDPSVALRENWTALERLRR